MTHDGLNYPAFRVYFAAAQLHCRILNGGRDWRALRLWPFLIEWDWSEHA